MGSGKTGKRIVAFISFVVAMAALIGVSWACDAVFVNRVPVWVQVDDAAAQEAPEGDNPEYIYELTAYDKDGEPREVAFGTQRRLRDDAYLKLETLALRGVVSWEEVSWNDLPGPVQVELPQPALG